MIRKVLRGKRINGLIRYLFGPGECNEHVNPHVVAGFRPPAALEPPLGEDGERDVRRLNMLLNQPLALIPDDEQHERPVRHIVLRAAPEDPVLSDDDWAAIAHEVMDATGRAPYGDDLAVRWVAVRHAPDHIHIAFNLARQDGGRPPAWDDYRALRKACQRMEARYGLRATAPADGTAAKRATRAESERAERSGRAEPVRNTLRRTVQHAAAAANSEAEFFARLAADGVQVRLRHSTREPGRVTGYAVADPGYVNGAGEPVWFGGGKLAADLTLPRLRARWTGPATTAPYGRTRTRPYGAPSEQRVALRETVQHAAAASGSESEFFGLLAEHGLRVRLRYSRTTRGEVTGYAVAQPAAAEETGTLRWIAAGRLAPELTLPQLRRRWRGVAGFEQRDHAYRWATDVVARAAADVGRLAVHDPAAAGDVAWAAADVLNVAARLLGNNRVVRQAAAAYDRAGRELRDRTPPPTRPGTELRAVARMLAGFAGEDRERTRAILTMIEQLAGLADAVAHLRAVQHRHAQAGAAVRAAELLRTGRTATAPPTTPHAATASTMPPHPGNDAQRTAAEDFVYDVHAIFTTPQARSPSSASPPTEPHPRSRGPRR